MAFCCKKKYKTIKKEKEEFKKKDGLEDGPFYLLVKFANTFTLFVLPLFAVFTCRGLVRWVMSTIQSEPQL